VSNRFPKERGYICHYISIQKRQNNKNIGAIQLVRTPNLKAEIVKKICRAIGFKLLLNEQKIQKHICTHWTILRLHLCLLLQFTVIIREKYKVFFKNLISREFLIPKGTKTRLWQHWLNIGRKGNTAKIHLLEVQKLSNTYAISNWRMYVVGKSKNMKTSKVYILTIRSYSSDNVPHVS